MLGAIIGDIAGSIYEFDNIKTKEFALFSPEMDYTDDSIMSLAIAQALLEHRGKGTNLSEAVTTEMQRLGRKYPYPMGAYGGRFSAWLRSDHPQPYNSFGNGSAMRVAAWGFAADTLEQALEYAEISAAVTHNHPEGIKGAKAVAGCIWLALHGADKKEIKAFVEAEYYTLDRSVDEIRPVYRFNESCQGTVPQAIQAFLDATDFQDAIRTAVSLGGDSDTLACITGGIAEAFYGIPEEMAQAAKALLPEDLLTILETFEAKFQQAS